MKFIAVIIALAATALAMATPRDGGDSWGSWGGDNDNNNGNGNGNEPAVSRIVNTIFKHNGRLTNMTSPNASQPSNLARKSVIAAPTSASQGSAFKRTYNTLKLFFSERVQMALNET